MKMKIISPPSPTARTGKGKRVNVCTITDALTRQLIKELSINLEMNRVEVITYLTQETYESDAYRKQIAQFYTDFWLRRETPYSGPISQDRMNPREEVVAMLEDLSWKIMGKRNRSELIRLLVTFWGWKKELLQFTK